VLWDISDGGARIAAARANDLPDIFCLLLTADSKSRRFCRVVWRKNGQVGVQFINESVADWDVDTSAQYPRRKLPSTAPVAPQVSRAHGRTARDLLLPGCGPHTPTVIERRGLAMSSIACGPLILLAAATAMFTVAGMQSAAEAPWALALCDGAANFCRHPEWTGASSIVMLLVYLAAKGMEL
jgi:hypothetical protein